MKFPAARIEALVWVLIYVGMVCAMLGIALQRNGAGFGWALTVVGAALVAAGILLVWIRSRMNGDR